MCAQTLGEHASENHHGAKPTLDRLSAMLLQKHAIKLTRFIGGPRWSELSVWEPFMADLSALTEGMEHLASAMVNKTGLDQAARQRKGPAHGPQHEQDLDGSDYKLHCSTGECHEKYGMLRGCVY